MKFKCLNLSVHVGECIAISSSVSFYNATTGGEAKEEEVGVKYLIRVRSIPASGL